MSVVAENISDQETGITDDVRWNLLQRKAAEVRALKAFEIFREHGIEPVLIKGLAAAQYYPITKLRQSVDMDLAFSSADSDAATALVRSGAMAGLAIDTHRELRHLDLVDWDDLFANTRLLEFDGGNIRVLRPEDHLRVLAVHWLTDGGANKDRLWDIFYMIDGRGTDFDWDRFLNVEPHRRRWLTCAAGLASRYLGLDLSGTPIEEEARDIPDWVIKTVESEWASETKLQPLEVSLGSFGEFAAQIKRRLNPNPIWSTVVMNGSFDAKTRFFYHIGTAFSRIMPSYRRITGK